MTERRRLPQVRHGVTHKGQACGFEFYVIVNFYTDEPTRPAEVFIKIAKEGTEISGLMDALCLTISVALQHGIEWECLSKHYKHTRFGAKSDDTCSSVLHGVTEAISKIIKDRSKEQADDPGTDA